MNGCHPLVRWQVGKSFWMHEAVSTLVLHGFDDGPHSLGLGVIVRSKFKVRGQCLDLGRNCGRLFNISIIKIIIEK